MNKKFQKKDNEILISIIIPIYNAKKTLDRCLKSILKQNSSKIEIILINDCSSDQSKKICKLYAKKFENIKFINQTKNLGVSGTRNNGIKNAKGIFLFFLDSDDFILDKSIKRIIQLVKKNINQDLIIAKKFIVLSWKDTFITHKVFKSKFNSKNSNQLFSELNKEKNTYGQIYNYIINRDFLSRNRIYFLPRANFAEDQEFVIQILFFMKNFSFYRDAYYCHCAGAGNLTNIMSYNGGLSCLMVANNLSQLLRLKHLSNIKKIYINRVIKKVLNQFLPKLIYFEKNEVYKFSKYIKLKIQNFNSIKFTFEKINIFPVSHPSNYYKELTSLRKMIMKALANIGKNKRKMPIYIFCFNYYGIAIAKSLIVNGYNIKGFIDNNSLVDGKKILGVKVKTPNFLNKKSYHFKSKIRVIISNEFIKNIKNITKQLIKFRIRKEQISYKII